MLLKFSLNVCRLASRSTDFSGTSYGPKMARRGFATQMKYPKISSIIFDFDGVILDTETIFFEANRRVFQRYGADYTKDLKLGQMGRKLTEGTEYIIKEAGLRDKVTVEDYIRQYDDILVELLDNIPEMPGARRLIDHLHANRVPMAICTGSAANEFRLKTRQYANIVEKFPLIVLAGDDPEVRHGKPAPDPYLVTMRRMRPAPADPRGVLVFEDSMNGVLSAAAAGNTVVWIPQRQFQPNNWSEVLARVGPKCAEVLTSIEEFEPAKYGLPPF